ncbi:MAG: PKD domain-containing protein [Acidobacteriaceae bacterium]|nr:PKD domain-containing protein [Acidobacteriaceae bacterium]
MKTRPYLKPISSAILAAALCFSGASYAQDTNSATNNTKAAAAKSGDTQDQYPDLVELDPFAGISTYGQIQRGLDMKLKDGWLAGGRIAVNPNRWFGLELWMDYDRANVNFRLPSNGGVYPATSPYAGAPIPNYSFHAVNWMWGLNPVFNLRPRGSKFQPYVTGGVGGVQFTPTGDAERTARDATINSSFYSGNLNDNLQVQFNYGGGIKWHLSDHFGLRVDARGFWSRNPTYDLPNYPDGGIYVPAHDHLNGFQGSIGLVFYEGKVSCDRFASQIPPQFQPAAPIPTPTISGAEGQAICQGKPVTLHANVTPAAGRNIAIEWTLNGAKQTATGPDFTFTPNNTGTFNVQVTVTDTTPAPKAPERPKRVPVRCWPEYTIPPNPAPVTATTTVTVNDQGPTISAVSADPNQLVAADNNPGPHTANLTVTAAAGPCSTNLTYKWTVSEGSLSNDTSQNPTFDASSLQFDPAQNQTKTITATVVVTDENQRTATQSTTITVVHTPVWKRLDDVVFAKNKDRVNNCGKDILIDQAAKQAGTDYDIVLVGHRDADENSKDVYGAPRRGHDRRHRAEHHSLDEQRVLNSAAVLSGGTATCGNLDPSHIRVDWVGTDQTSDTKPGLCGTSNIKERKGSQTSEADKNRRVEVYLVPRNSQAMPPAVKNVKPLPEDEVKALGCPK